MVYLVKNDKNKLLWAGPSKEKAEKFAEIRSYKESVKVLVTRETPNKEVCSFDKGNKSE